MSIVYRDDLMLVAKEIALTNFDDSTKVGCLLVTRGGILVSSGCNRFPDGVKFTTLRQQRPDKYDWIVHAEMNALAHCCTEGKLTQGLISYSTQIPCSTCMGMFIQCGITGVFCPDPVILAEKWKHNANISVQMALEGGLTLKFV